LLLLTSDQQAMLAGEAGDAAALALRLIVRFGEIKGAQRLVPITAAHVDGCLYHGPVSIDFAQRLVDGGGKTRVPTTLNVGAIDLLHPTLFRGDPALARAARQLMSLYAALGCRATWTCAPYQLSDRPTLGEHVAWAESNAIVFANSVLGARTERYGDFTDIAAAIVGYVPDAGLHRDEGRHATLHIRVRGISRDLAASDVLFAALGHFLGRRAGAEIAVIDGIDHASEDQLKALGAGGASSGAVAMFHCVGITPEAPTLEAACGGRPPRAVVDVGPPELMGAIRELTSATDDELGAVSIGTPHFSFAEFTELRRLLDGRQIAERIEFFVSTGRDILAQVTAAGWLDDFTRAGVRVVSDTCTYITPILSPRSEAVMTNSAKWAWYAPSNLGRRVVFGSLRECVESGVRGTVWRDASLWGAINEAV
jgi:predicted aconitase